MFVLPRRIITLILETEKSPHDKCDIDGNKNDTSNVFLLSIERYYIKSIDNRVKNEFT